MCVYVQSRIARLHGFPGKGLAICETNVCVHKIILLCVCMRQCIQMCTLSHDCCAVILMNRASACTAKMLGFIFMLLK